jgi:hypothetical protein
MLYFTLNRSGVWIIAIIKADIFESQVYYARLYIWWEIIRLKHRDWDRIYEEFEGQFE